MDRRDAPIGRSAIQSDETEGGRLMFIHRLAASALVLALVWVVGTEVHAGSPYEVNAARRSADIAWYNVNMSRENLGQFSRSGYMAKSWNRLYSAAVKRSPVTSAAYSQFRADMDTLTRYWDDIISKAYAAIRAYNALYEAEYRLYATSNREGLQIVRKRRDQSVQSMANLISRCQQGKANDRRYWNSHLLRLPR